LKGYIGEKVEDVTYSGIFIVLVFLTHFRLVDCVLLACLPLYKINFLVSVRPTF
jgi:hypothetical protein